MNSAARIQQQTTIETPRFSDRKLRMVHSGNAIAIPAGTTIDATGSENTAIAARLEALATLVVSGLSAAVIATVLMTLSNGSFASVNVGDAADVIASERYLSSGNVKEKALAGWAVSMDNDILVPSSRDQDYTYGSSLTVAGSSMRNAPLSLHRPLDWLNRQLGISAKNKTPVSHSVEVGLYGFTP